MNDYVSLAAIQNTLAAIQNRHLHQQGVVRFTDPKPFDISRDRHESPEKAGL
jgi:hypothetical protein